jgi:beta-lactamase class A
MIDTLDRNQFPNLLEAGAPDGIRIAHKHGYVTDAFGATLTIGDAGIVYTPSGNYVLVIYFDHPVQLIWDSASTLFANLAKAVYNYYNIPTS